MGRELKEPQDETSSASQEVPGDDPRECVTLADLYRATDLVDLDSLEVERVEERPGRVMTVMRSLTMGVIGSLVASALFEFYIEKVLRAFLG